MVYRWRRQGHEHEKNVVCADPGCGCVVAVYNSGRAFRRKPCNSGQDLCIRYLWNNTWLCRGICAGDAADAAGTWRRNYIPGGLSEFGCRRTALYGRPGLYSRRAAASGVVGRASNAYRNSGCVSCRRIMGFASGMDEEQAWNLRDRKYHHVQLHRNYDCGYLYPRRSSGSGQLSAAKRPYP